MSLLLPSSLSHGTTNLSPLHPLASLLYPSINLVPNRLLNNNLSRTHVTTTTTTMTSTICCCRQKEKVHGTFSSSINGHQISRVFGTLVGRVRSSSKFSSYNGCSGSDDAIAQELGSRSDGEEEEGQDSDEGEELEEGLGIRASAGPERWDVLGLGQAMVDFSGVVDDEFLERLGLEKGTRKLVNHEERGRILRAMDGCSYKAAAGGSLSNTLVALARLGGRFIGGPALNVAMAGSVGGDPLGGFYRAKLCRANVNFLSKPVKDGTTGTVIVLTTPDAQRTMLAYQGTSSTVSYHPYLASVISKTNILIVEGYLFELPHTIKTIAKACEDAHRNGALVAVTASDVSCIERHYDDFWDIIGNYADIVFANTDEARAFCHFSSKESPVSATRYLSHFVPLVSVTDGHRGSYIGVKGEAIFIPPSPCVPVDTCGAGDAYASGILYGILRGVSDLKGMGTLAARVAAVVVGQQGTRLRVQDAVELAESFAFQINSSNVHFDVGSDHISSF
ncbi:uncharacterized sugar kinase slr0537 [Telopea speciosissima]|uniref:uncharacterized sugar kinase slr0537 n=1 Tax=Telopea speciosissima TaxID=54955 RepID=UPI001CC3368F|nr:uncharacterized sugar kinase slr0537 [Telopea speciosissima]